mgnify:CR=1 FL=1
MSYYHASDETGKNDIDEKDLPIGYGMVCLHNLTFNLFILYQQYNFFY